MARTIVNREQVIRSGIEPDYVVGTVDGLYVPNNGKTILVIKNTGASVRTLSIPVAHTVDGLAVTDRTVDVPAGAVVLAGPFSANVYNQKSGTLEGQMLLDFPAGFESELSVAAIEG